MHTDAHVRSINARARTYTGARTNAHTRALFNTIPLSHIRATSTGETDRATVGEDFILGDRLEHLSFGKCVPDGRLKSRRPRHRAAEDDFPHGRPAFRRLDYFAKKAHAILEKDLRGENERR